MSEAMHDYGFEAQQAAEEMLERFYDEDQCGCTTCLVREVLTVAWPIIEEYVRNNPEPLS